MESVINKYGVVYHVGLAVLILGSKGTITKIDIPDHTLWIQSERGISKVDIDASNAVISTFEQKQEPSSEKTCLEKQSISNETAICTKESDSSKYSDPETQTSISTTTDPSIENDYSLEEEEDSNRTYPGDNPFMNPYKEKLPSWNKMTHIQRLGILQRYYSAGKNMVLESLPIKQHDQKRMDEILELVTDYVDQEYFEGGHNRMDYHALQFALFILLFTKNKSYEIKEETKKRLLESIITLLDSMEYYLFKPSWKWDPLSVILSCGFSQSVIPTSLFVKVWIGLMTKEWEDRDKSFSYFELDSLIESLSTNECLSIEVDYDASYPMKEKYDSLYDDDDFDMYEKNEDNWQGVLVQEYTRHGYMREYYTAKWSVSQSFISVAINQLKELYSDG